MKEITLCKNADVMEFDEAFLAMKVSGYGHHAEIKNVNLMGESFDVKLLFGYYKFNWNNVLFGSVDAVRDNHLGSSYILIIRSGCQFGYYKHDDGLVVPMWAAGILIKNITPKTMEAK